MKVSRTILVSSSPEEAWAVVGAVGDLQRWVPGITSCEMVGDVRTIRADGGVTIVERIVSRDDVNRRYQYHIEQAPFELRSHLATFQVLADGNRSQVVWTAEIEPPEAAEVLAGSSEGMLNSLKTFLEPSGSEATRDSATGGGRG